MIMMKRSPLLISILVIILIIGGIVYFSLGGDNGLSIDEQIPQQNQTNEVEKPVNETKIEDRRLDQIILIEDYKFSPKELSIERGERVTWINNGEKVHYVLSIRGLRLADSGNMQPGQNYSVLFDVEPGTYEYFDPIYKSNMFGKIIVK